MNYKELLKDPEARAEIIKELQSANFIGNQEEEGLEGDELWQVARRGVLDAVWGEVSPSDVSAARLFRAILQGTLNATPSHLAQSLAHPIPTVTLPDKSFGFEVGCFQRRFGVDTDLHHALLGLHGFEITRIKNLHQVPYSWRDAPPRRHRRGGTEASSLQPPVQPLPEHSLHRPTKLQ